MKRWRHAGFVRCASPTLRHARPGHDLLRCPRRAPLPARALGIVAHSRRTQAASSKRRPRRKTDAEIRRGRETRERKAVPRRPVVAVWNGAVLAESRDYEFLDGRFWFPGGDVRWALLRDSGETRNHNPVGLVRMYDVEVPQGGRLWRNRRAAVCFDDAIKKPWDVMRGFVSFWKGVTVRDKLEGDDVAVRLRTEPTGAGAGAGE